MQQKQYRREDLIFRQGDPSDCMYGIKTGKVGIFLDYGEATQTKLTELADGQYFGEMGFLDKAPRSATAVVLSDDTALIHIDEDSFSRFLAEDPGKMLLMLQQMSMRLRRISRDYADACRTVSDVVEAEKTGKTRDAVLENRIAKTLAGYEASKLEGREEGAPET